MVENELQTRGEELLGDPVLSGRSGRRAKNASPLVVRRFAVGRAQVVPILSATD